MQANILYIEDDKRLAQLVVNFLQAHQYQVTHLPSTEGAIDLIYYGNFDAILLDIGLPGESGFELCQQVRAHFAGQILFMTARRSALTEIEGLQLGADDYLMKPVAPELLLARLQTRLNSGKRQPLATADSPVPNPQELTFGRLCIKLNARQAYFNGQSLQLTTAEFDILAQLSQQAGQIVSRDALFQQTTGGQYDGLNRTMDSRISRLRKKLGDDLDTPYRIKTIWGKGYLFVPDSWQ